VGVRWHPPGEMRSFRERHYFAFTQVRPVAEKVKQSDASCFTATLTGPISNASPAGTLTFFDGSTPFATTPIAANTQGNTVTATISKSTLTVGTRAITANYPGSLNFNPAISAPVTVTITPWDYTLITPNPDEHYLSVPLTLLGCRSVRLGSKIWGG
jgi:Bacterial Ig-like domain (group 3)